LAWRVELAGQITEAFPWISAPAYLVRDNDGAFVFTHLRRILDSYTAYYNQARTHLALQKDAPLHRTASSIRPDMIFGKDRSEMPVVESASPIEWPNETSVPVVNSMQLA
jgi:hypothetical protein